ncbi:MAG TPA: hypothetical protein VKE74_23350 [Gemmataceae bacterium]|nr:hypothetical protein [Gemmataceae bacterium]
MIAPTIPASTARSDRPLSLAAGVILAVWFGAVFLTSVSGQFVTEADQPPLAMLSAVLLPIGVFGAAYASSARVWHFVREGDPGLLTALQSWRILGLVFVVLLAFGMLPAAFAIPAGLGDMAIGVTAPFVARARAERGPDRAGRLFVIWQWLGILDLVVAVGTAASLRILGIGAAGSEQMVLMGQFPLSLIPAFAVPLFVIFHLASLAQYRARTHASDQEPRD